MMVAAIFSPTRMDNGKWIMENKCLKNLRIESFIINYPLSIIN